MRWVPDLGDFFAIEVTYNSEPEGINITVAGEERAYEMTHTDQPERRQPPMSPQGDFTVEPIESSRKSPARSAPARPAPARRAAGRGVAPAVARQIDENLKRLYREQIAQDLPPELAALVARLRESEPGTDTGDEGSK